MVYLIMVKELRYARRHEDARIVAVEAEFVP
jgi:hypothetical protein